MIWFENFAFVIVFVFVSYLEMFCSETHAEGERHVDINFRLVVLHHLMRFLEHQDTDGDFGSHNELGHRLFAANHVLSQDGKENV